MGRAGGLEGLGFGYEVWGSVDACRVGCFLESIVLFCCAVLCRRVVSCCAVRCCECFMRDLSLVRRGGVEGEGDICVPSFQNISFLFFAKIIITSKKRNPPTK